eukprot:1025629-Ditylum_brightwellii.AAC.1
MYSAGIIILFAVDNISGSTTTGSLMRTSWTEMKCNLSLSSLVSILDKFTSPPTRAMVSKFVSTASQTSSNSSGAWLGIGSEASCGSQLVLPFRYFTMYFAAAACDGMALVICFTMMLMMV